MSQRSVEKYRIPGVAICRSRRQGESDNIPAKEDLAAIVKNFDPQRLQVPCIRGHEEADGNGDAQGWLLGLRTQNGGEDLVLFADMECAWGLGYDLINGHRGPRSIRWHDNPYGRGPEILHLAFLGAKNPGVDGLPPIDAAKIQPVKEEPAEGQEPAMSPWALEKTYCANPVMHYKDCEFAPFSGDVPANRQEEPPMAMTPEETAKMKELEAEASKSKDLARKVEDQEKELAAARKEKFDLSLAGILQKVPEGARENIKQLAETAAATDHAKALELATKLAEGAAKTVPPEKAKELTAPLGGSKDGENQKGFGALDAHNLELANKAMGVTA